MKTLNEELNRIIKEVRVPRSERVELYKDENIIVVVPLTHRALKKYAHECQWCINSDLDEWEDYHKGKHTIIIQRNPKKPKIGIKYPIPEEIFTIEHYTDIDSIYSILGYRFSSNEERDDYMDDVTSNINNFATNIIYYSPSGSLYDQEDNYLPSYGYSISDIPNVTPEVIKIMDDYLQENEEMSLQESIRRILREEVIKENSRLNYILDKIERYGLKSLSPKEKEFLDNKSLDKDTEELERFFDNNSRELESRIEYDPREDPNDFYDELGIDFSHWSDEDIDKGRYEIIWNDLDEETINHFFKYFNIDENKYLNDEGYLPGHIPEEIFNDFKKYVKEILLF